VLILSPRATHTARHVRALRAVGLGTRRRRMPRQIWPKSIETEYGKAMIALLDRGRVALEPLLHELPGMVDRAAADRRGDRMDAGEAERARRLIEIARQRLEQAVQPTDVDALARLFGQRTQTYQRVQLGRQVHAALGVDVLAADGRRVATVLDHFVHENAVLIKSVPADCIAEIEKRVTQAFSNATPNARLADEIEERFSVSESRARLIARDQIGKLYGQTNATRQEDIGILSFIWRTAGDERVREEHQELDGQEFQYSDPPSEGLPGEPIQCRCYAEPVLGAILDASADET
jgi:SPP1 gp7 family putative phage head morphogenesis protein